jgi:hypothetical protein
MQKRRNVSMNYLRNGNIGYATVIRKQYATLPCTRPQLPVR